MTIEEFALWLTWSLTSTISTNLVSVAEYNISSIDPRSSTAERQGACRSLQAPFCWSVPLERSGYTPSTVRRTAMRRLTMLLTAGIAALAPIVLAQSTGPYKVIKTARVGGEGGT